MTMAVLTLFGLFFTYTGLHSLIAPRGFARILSLEPIGRSGDIEIRAQYGGFFLAAGLAQFAALSGHLTQSTALMISFVIFGGLIMGRLLALLFQGDGAPISPAIKALYVIDAIGCVSSAIALWVMP